MRHKVSMIGHSLASTQSACQGTHCTPSPKPLCVLRLKSSLLTPLTLTTHLSPVSLIPLPKSTAAGTNFPKYESLYIVMCLKSVKQAPFLQDQFQTLQQAHRALPLRHPELPLQVDFLWLLMLPYLQPDHSSFMPLWACHLTYCLFCSKNVLLLYFHLAVSCLFK